MIFIFLIAFVLTTISYKFTTKGLKKYYNHRYERAKEIFTAKTRYDILFIGSSRTHTTIIPRIIDSVTGLTSYNAGVEGGLMHDFKMTFDGYLVNHPSPALLVLTIDPGSFNYVPFLWNPMQYFPFVAKNKAVEKTFASHGFRPFIFKYIPSFSYIYMDDYSKNMAFAGLRGQSEIEPGEFENKGYLSNTYKCVDTVKYKYDTSYSRPRARQLSLFQSIIDTCKKRNIQVILTYAPEYNHQFLGTIRNARHFTGVLSLEAKINGLLLFRDDSLAMNTDSCLFRDLRHVNTAGGMVYSRILGERIKTLIK